MVLQMNMKSNKTYFIIIVVVIFLTLVGMATFAYFSVGTFNVTNVANMNLVTEGSNMVFVTQGGEMSLNVTMTNMQKSHANNSTAIASNSTTLKVDFTANTSYAMVCTYDITFTWVSTDKYKAHSSGVTSNEFTIQATLATNSHVTAGTNSISTEKDIVTAVGNVDTKVVVTGAKIDSTGTTKNTATWTITSKFYNVNAAQTAVAGKTYQAKFHVTGVACTGGTV